MNTTWSLQEKSQGELKVVVSGETWLKAQKKAFTRLAKEVSLPGFRKGQVPEAMLKGKIPTMDILREAVDLVVPEAFNEGMKQHDIAVISRPEVGVEAISEEEVTLTFKMTVRPEVKLGTYKGLTVERPAVDVSDEDITSEITRLQERHAELVLKEEGTVEEGDTAVIDFEGFKDDVAFEGGKGENYPLVIGSNTFIPGFEEQLVGMTAGEEKEISVIFPEEYPAENLKGQPVVFKVKVNEIKQKHVPALDEEFVKDVNLPNVNTLEELKGHVTSQLSAKKLQEADNAVLDQLLTQVAEQSEVELPEVLVADEVERLMQDFEQRLMAQGLDLESFKQFSGQNDEQIRGNFRTDAENKVKLRLVLEEIAKQEGIAVSDEEIEEEYNMIAQAYRMEVKRVKELASKDALAYDIRNRKAVDLIRESAK